MECVPPSEQLTSDCNFGYFKFSSKNCNSESQFPSTITSDNYTAQLVGTDWLIQGYNRALGLTNIAIKAGSYLAWMKNSTGSIMLNPACDATPPASFQYSGLTSAGLPIINSTGSCAFYFNVFIARTNIISALKNYSSPGQYTVTASVVHTYSTTPISQSQSVLVVGNLTNLNIVVSFKTNLIIK